MVFASYAGRPIGYALSYLLCIVSLNTITHAFVISDPVSIKKRRGCCSSIPHSQKRAKRAILFGSASSSSSGSTRSSISSGRDDVNSINSNNRKQQYSHVLAVLCLPLSSADRIANEAILAHAMSITAPSQTLSVVLRRRDDDDSHSLSALRRYVGEIYSTAWDVAGSSDSDGSGLLNLVVYPQNLPNTPPESWLHHRPDLECVCSHDSMLGWHSTGSGRADDYENVDGDGLGGLDAHVRAMNDDRRSRGLSLVQASHVERWPMVLDTATAVTDGCGRVVFLEDEPPDAPSNTEHDTDSQQLLYNYVSVGGTFDGMHYGHRKLLTLAVSSVASGGTGRLLVGVTSDEMLTKKTLADLIPPLDERVHQVENFLAALAPGLKNNMRIVELHDTWGPPAYEEAFDALVLSDEVLEVGLQMNSFRKRNGYKEMDLLCTRRTEPNAMSSTMLRRWRRQQQDQTFNEC